MQQFMQNNEHKSLKWGSAPNKRSHGLNPVDQWFPVSETHRTEAWDYDVYS